MSFADGRRDLVAAGKLREIMSSVRGVVFDLDGTLTDSVAGIIECTLRTFEQAGLALPSRPAILATIGLELSEGLTRLLPEELRHRGREITVRYREHFLNTPRFYEDRLFAGLEELFAGLRGAGYKIGFASGRSRAGILRTLNATFLGGYCDGLAAGDESPSKPHPELMLKVCRALGLSPGEILGVGDADLDIRMFQNAGARALGVQTGVWSGEALLTLAPDALLPAAADLRDYF